VTVELPAEHGGELQALHVALELRERSGELRRELVVAIGREQLVDRRGVVEAANESVVAVELGPEAGEPRRQALAAIGIVPERGIRRLPLELDELVALRVDVKGTPWRPRRARAGPSRGPCAPSRPRDSTDDARGDGGHRPAVTDPTPVPCGPAPNGDTAPPTVDGRDQREDPMMTVTTIRGIGTIHLRIGDGWWAAASIVLLGAALAIALALTLGPLDRPFDPQGLPSTGSSLTGSGPAAYELGNGIVCAQCEPAT
jgi:hypothetical protein